MAEKYVKRVNTTDGNLRIDYKALANLPIIDTELDLTSDNAVANKVLAALVEEINAALQEIIAIDEELLIPDGNEVAY